MEGMCSNCGREADDLRKCAGRCKGDVMYCNQLCQKLDWRMHKKICPRGNRKAQTLNLTVPTLALEGPDVPVRAVRRLDGHGNSGLTLVYSDHLGVEKLIPFAEMYFDTDEDGDEDDKPINVAKCIAGNEAWLNFVTTPVSPSQMKLKPEEAAFNTEKYPDVYKSLIDSGIITDTGKRVKLGLYPHFPICRIHAPQTEDREENKRSYQMHREMLEKMNIL